MTASKVQIKVVLDDGGSAALCVWRDKYAHGYDYDMTQLADDIIALRDGDDCNYWDNNQWGTGVSRSDSSCRDYIGTPKQVIREILADYRNNNIYGGNHIRLAVALKAKKDV